ncbi:flagellar hook-length control protein FliK [Sphingomonas sp. 37zxx]|uniref:flagellar hook-length control protein FliK n=1 Tax=Sphingomonas sp. 37zxx TaxID=1550073 RepID=UPI0018CF50AE|nr:flagellar hook-length control protein FliK [Sphingomonas sp. 37zxx]
MTNLLHSSLLAVLASPTPPRADSAQPLPDSGTRFAATLAGLQPVAELPAPEARLSIAAPVEAPITPLLRPPFAATGKTLPPAAAVVLAATAPIAPAMLVEAEAAEAPPVPQPVKPTVTPPPTRPTPIIDKPLARRQPGSEQSASEPTDQPPETTSDTDAGEAEPTAPAPAPIDTTVAPIQLAPTDNPLPLPTSPPPTLSGPLLVASPATSEPNPAQPIIAAAPAQPRRMPQQAVAAPAADPPAMPRAPEPPFEQPVLPARQQAAPTPAAGTADTPHLASQPIDTTQVLRARSNVAFPASQATPTAETPDRALPAIEPAPLGTAPIERSAALEAPAPLAPVATNDPAWMDAMIERIETLRDTAGARETRIRLTPDALGTVEVTIRETADGVQVQLTADTPAARTLLAEAAPRLTEMADARGLKLGQLDAGTGQSGDQRAPPEPQRARPNRTASSEQAAEADERIA